MMALAASPARSGIPLPMLTDKDRAAITAMVRLGIPRMPASCLVAISRYSRGEPVSQYWLDRIADLRQPEVSLGMRWLEKHGIVVAEEYRVRLPGRPMKRYKLARPVIDVIREIVDERQALLKSDTVAVYAAMTEAAA